MKKSMKEITYDMIRALEDSKTRPFEASMLARKTPLPKTRIFISTPSESSNYFFDEKKRK